MHVVRDCEVARQFWVCVLPSDSLQEFFSLDMKEWIMWLIKKGKEMENQKRWAEKILIASWMQWKWRNEECFEGRRRTLQERLRGITGLWEEDDKAMLLEGIQPDARLSAFGP